MLVCLATALACGLVAGAVGPQILIGSVAGDPASAGAGQDAARLAAASKTAVSLALAEDLRLDPREVQANAIRWASLTEADRRAFLDRYWHLAEMDRTARERLVKQYLEFRELPENRQEFLKARALRVKEFVSTLSPQDQALLESMGDAQRAERLLQLWQARYGKW